MLEKTLANKLVFIIIISACILSCEKDSPVKPENNEFNEHIVVSTPEPYELFNVAIALTNSGIQDYNYVNHNTDYYIDVQDYFYNFKNHPFILGLDNFCNNNIYLFNNIKVGGLYSYFDGDSLVIEKEAYELLSDSMIIIVDHLMIGANQFVRDSDFHSFYNSHTKIYQDRIRYFKEGIPILNMWKWLESQFVARYHTYYIPLSPLTGGSHFTEILQFSKEGAIGMFVSGPDHPIDNPVEEGDYSRILFTEIDHNYVNPISDLYRIQIDQIFSDLDKWNKQNGYRTPISTFNEYMTWAVFTCFAYDRYIESDFNKINNHTVDTMESGRKFIRFRNFNEELLWLYNTRQSDEILIDLFPKILDWAENQ